ncbi:MAG: alcohol dehydrogenase catalytic domain-containing protein [Rhodospirillaceae bacterium]|nr:alcohol dehydrogenase catalytic domain-containing protein [Rhodospirillaceae bacterium]MBT3911492.1 alcohol dehydrogenase catalytic domain-containing protein [Rhodospirillaceae bacterium]MBT5300276.1 alcohol dehydrogenase catalytic domain-containing protein [Rhodospirillaceae bacterium]MBT5512475.1 alcohol dehydrogenase catalytic domain-containing protein [Rhodospirillaceae bacterium]MBT6085393.1 alcohol dehydrogenase catalytic domain-containing protein [Rhodospirillaceae bacterium]
MKIRAAVLLEMERPKPYATSKPVEIIEVDLDPPGAGEVLVEMKAAGVCHSDLSIVNGSRPRPTPMVLGHEAAGVVAEVGDGVTSLKVGDHVAFVFVPSCGHCDPCMSGRPALCEPGAEANAAGTLLSGERRLSWNGDKMNHQVGVSCFAEFAVVSERSLIKLDKELPLDEAALFSCAVLTGVGAVLNAAEMAPGATAAVVGLGGVGLNALLAAKMLGAQRIVAIDTNDEKLAQARQLGATDTFNATDPNCVENVRDATGGGLEYAFEAAGSVKAMETAYKITRRGGTVTTVGLSHPEHSFSVQHVNLVAEEKTIKGSYLGSGVPARDIPRYIGLYQRGVLPVDKLITARIPLDEINEAFDRLDDGSELRQVIVF